MGVDFDIPAGEFINPANRGYMRFDELEQGKFADCWFVAALSSLLFVQRRFAPVKDTDGNYSFYFNTGGTFSDPISTSGKVCLEGVGIYGAKAVDGASIFSWPAVYEKAYGAFLENVNYPPDPPEMQTYIDNPDGVALSCLQQLKGGASHPFSSNVDIYATISPNTFPPLGLSRSVRDPYVAWTGDGNPGIGIDHHHSYSILGLYSNQYIILRDPRPAGKPDGEAIDWTYRDIVLGGVPTTIHCQNNNKGIFAIKTGDFITSFEGFGYVR